MERFSKKTVIKLCEWLAEQNVPMEVIESFEGMDKCSVMCKSLCTCHAHGNVLITEVNVLNSIVTTTSGSDFIAD